MNAPIKTPLDDRGLLDQLAAWNIATFTHDHPPLRTVADSKALRGNLPGGHCKNLFLKDKKDRLYLVVCDEDREVDLKALRKVIGAAHLSFGRPELLAEVLGVRPGAVTPFALINDREKRVHLVLDRAMIEGHDLLNYHPLRNDRTTALTPAALLAFFRQTGHPPQVVDL
ncbi:MAG: prolyl-tRNA synthetase associated domain-containing protein [Rhodospirillales bacterium]